MASNIAVQQKNRSASKNKSITGHMPHLSAASTFNQPQFEKGTTRTVEDTRNHLYALLQTSLDLNELLSLFRKEVSSIIEIGSCHYQNTASDVQINLGERKRHNCTYRLRTQDDHLGELVFTRRTRFTDAEIDTLELLMCTAIYPIRNALKYREAMNSALTDALTGAGNRLSLNTSLDREVELSRRYDQPLSLLIIDLDHFKNVNDQYGHTTGDRVLKQVAKEIQNRSRCADMTFRYGGEEFVVLLSKTDKKGAKVISERIRAAIEKLSCVQETGQRPIPVTVSIGCATLSNNNAEELLEKADEALYTAKSNGRNLVCYAD